MTLYSIGIVAKHYDVSPSTIRRWVEKGLLAVVCHTFGGHR
jgi:DNA-binding transcriptional MerR regulator